VFTQVVAQDANCDEAYLGRGQIRLTSRNAAAALADVDRAIALQPDYSEA